MLQQAQPRKVWEDRGGSLASRKPRSQQVQLARVFTMSKLGRVLESRLTDAVLMVPTVEQLQEHLR